MRTAATDLPAVVVAWMAIVLVAVVAKFAAALVGLVRQVRRGGRVAVALRAGVQSAPEDFHDLIYNSNFLDSFLYAADRGPLRATVARLFWAPLTVGLAALTLVGIDLGTLRHTLSEPSGALALVLGFSTALSASVHILTAVVRRLIFGADDSRAHDLAASPRFGSGATSVVSERWLDRVFEEWAVFVEEGSNLPLYFLGLVYLAVVGFVATYAAIDATVSHSFSPSPLATSVLTSLYLSVTTVSTVGFGDVHAEGFLADGAVIWQMAIGPLLLSWLLAVFLTPSHSQHRQSASE